MEMEEEQYFKRVPVGEITEHQLLNLLHDDFALIVSFCKIIQGTTTDLGCINRRFMARVHLECALCEKLLDPFSAQENYVWRPLRKLIAITKHFSTLCLNLLQIRHVQILHSYNPEEIEGDFLLATDMARKFSVELLRHCTANLLQQAQKMGIADQEKQPISSKLLALCQKSECDICLTLPADIERRQETDTPMIIHLASNLLHIIHENRELVSLYSRTSRDEYAQHLPDPLSEENLGSLATHYLAQLTIYDTFVGNTIVVKNDLKLRNFRGYLETMVLLLETAALILRYIERHQSFYQQGDYHVAEEKPQQLLELLFEYFLLYIDRYNNSILKQCQLFLKKYSVTEKINVNIPNYRGFHVRPSNLIARIVNHYGSDVTMILEKEHYDAASPLSLFRANEKINALKRQNVGNLVRHNSIFKAFITSYASEKHIPPSSIRKAFFRILDDLKNDGNVMVYGNVSQMHDAELEPSEGEKLLDFIKRAVAFLMAASKIDVISNIGVVFVGDRRTLTDIKTLAEHGYGEDDMGNNIMLPQELFYLKR